MNNDRCAACPCPDSCIRLSPRWCEWAAEEPPDPTRLRSICERSAIEHAKAAYPPLAQQAGNLLGAAGRVVAAVAKGGPIRVPPEVLEERRAICRACPEFDPGPQRCRLCGCYTQIKVTLATERCPLEPPRWDKWEETDGRS